MQGGVIEINVEVMMVEVGDSTGDEGIEVEEVGGERRYRWRR